MDLANLHDEIVRARDDNTLINRDVLNHITVTTKGACLDLANVKSLTAVSRMSEPLTSEPLTSEPLTSEPLMSGPSMSEPSMIESIDEQEISGYELSRMAIELCNEYVLFLGTYEGSGIWKKFMVVLFSDNFENAPCFISGHNQTKQELLSRLQTIESNHAGAVISEMTINFRGIQYHLTPPFYKAEVSGIFRTFDKEKIKQALMQSTMPLLQRTSASGFRRAEPRLEFVKYEPENTLSNWDTLAAEKKFALVVAGESGSGKSVNACLLAQKYGYDILYCVMERKHMGTRPAGKEYPFLSKFIDGKIQEIHLDKSRRLDDFPALLALKEELNKNRNLWATRALKNAIRAIPFSDTQMQLYLNGMYPSKERPEKVAIVIDEAVDIDLAEGLVDAVRWTRDDYLQKLAHLDLIIILVGTGLELLRSPDRMGTDPAKSRVVIIKGPSLDALETSAPDLLNSAVKNGIQRGSISRVLMTNARMLFDSVLPFMTLAWHTIDANGLTQVEKNRRLEDRLTSYGSHLKLMDHAVRNYSMINTVGQLTERNRFDLLQEAFVYHHISAMKELLKEMGLSGDVGSSVPNGLHWVKWVIGQELAVAKELPQVRSMEENNEQIFTVGLARASGTSNALKFFACFELADSIGPSSGPDFEELVSLHVMRFMQVKGYNVDRRRLKYAWPPAYSGRSQYSKKDLSRLRKKLGEQFLDELDHIDLQSNDCLILFQGTPTAQGADILVLTQSVREGTLEAIQCKYIGDDSSPPSQTFLENSFVSLGVQFNPEPNKRRNRAILSPSKGKAGYSYLGLDRLRELLQSKLNKTVRLGKRIVATSKNPTALQNIFMEEHDNLVVWYRAMLEPTISAVNAGPETTISAMGTEPRPTTPVGSSAPKVRGFVQWLSPRKSKPP